MPTDAASWFLDHADAVAAVVLFVIVVAGLVQLTVNANPSRTRCNAPNRRRGRCRNALRPGRHCAAGHGTSWIGGEAVTLVVVGALAAAIAIIQPVATYVIPASA